MAEETTQSMVSEPTEIPVYVDDLRPWTRTPVGPFKDGVLACFLFVAQDIPEQRAALHALAGKLNLRTGWFQRRPWPHYLLTEGARRRAVKLGAVSVSRLEGIGLRDAGKRARRAAKMSAIANDGDSACSDAPGSRSEDSASNGSACGVLQGS